MLVWHKELWLIDHGASLFFHHSWNNWEEQSRSPFVQLKDHVLLPWAMELEAVDKVFRSILTPETIRCIINYIPDEWLMGDGERSIKESRQVYEQFFLNRLTHSMIFIKEAQDARKALI